MFVTYFRDTENNLEPCLTGSGELFELTSDSISSDMTRNNISEIEATKRMFDGLDMLLLNNWKTMSFLKDYKKKRKKLDK